MDDWVIMGSVTDVDDSPDELGTEFNRYGRVLGDDDDSNVVVSISDCFCLPYTFVLLVVFKSKGRVPLCWVVFVDRDDDSVVALVWCAFVSAVLFVELALAPFAAVLVVFTLPPPPTPLLTLLFVVPALPVLFIITATELAIVFNSAFCMRVSIRVYIYLYIFFFQ